jgi:hypothetical protein
MSLLPLLPSSLVTITQRVTKPKLNCTAEVATFDDVTQGHADTWYSWT